MEKRLAQINSVCNGSTGKIMGDIQRLANKEGYETISFYGRRKGFSDLKCEKIESILSVLWHAFITFVFNKHGHGSYFATKRLVKKLKQFNPDIIQLHNIHGYYLNYKVLLKYLKNDYNGKLFITLHDCWTFTGHCAYFTYVKCERWKKECYNCPQKTKYPISYIFDTSKKEYNIKKDYFNGLHNFTIITPSVWLSKLVKESYLKNYKTIVINNGIDLTKFKKCIDNNIKTKYFIPKDKKIILGVANIWEKRKGLDTFLELSKIIKENEIIVLVGLTEKQKQSLPSNIIGISRTDNVQDLVKIYSISEVLVNPTKEDNYPTVNIESIACGTPIITANIGGCKEQVFENTGYYYNTFNELKNKLRECLDNDYKKNIFTNQKCLNKIDAKEKYKEYLKYYKN